MPKIRDEWRTKWPDEVELPDAIGTGKHYVDGKPHCAVGHVQLAIPRGGQEWGEWRLAYIRAAQHVLGLSKHPYHVQITGVERVNDSFCNEDQRVILYAVAWGLCGYDLLDEKGKTWAEPTRIVEAILKGEQR